MSLLDTGAGCASGSMGLSYGLQLSQLNPKKKNRWMLRIIDVAATANALPPKKAGRPGINLKETEFHHLSESIWYPLKADWKTVNVTLFDIRCSKNPVFDWLTYIYDSSAEETDFLKVIDSDSLTDMDLELYDGCGNVIETWKFEKAYPQSIEWGELDMDSADIVLVDMVIRYRRAYFIAT